MLICVGLWTISRLLVYGSDIGAKFHLAASTAVRGEFDTTGGKGGSRQGSRRPSGGGDDPQAAAQRKHSTRAPSDMLCYVMRRYAMAAGGAQGA